MVAALADNQENPSIRHSIRNFLRLGQRLCYGARSRPEVLVQRAGQNEEDLAWRRRSGNSAKQLSRPGWIHQSCNPRVKGRIFFIESVVTGHVNENTCTVFCGRALNYTIATNSLLTQLHQYIKTHTAITYLNHISTIAAPIHCLCPIQ